VQVEAMTPQEVLIFFDKNCINVTVSRAQSLAIVVGNPVLATTNASTVRQQSKINLFSLIQQTGQENKDTES